MGKAHWRSQGSSMATSIWIRPSLACPTRRITAAELRRLCEAPAPDTPIGLRDRALLATLASSGCRVAEVVALTMAQLDDSAYI